MILRNKAAPDIIEINPAGMNFPDFDQRKYIIAANVNDAPNVVIIINQNQILRSTKNFCL